MPKYKNNFFVRKKCKNGCSWFVYAKGVCHSCYKAELITRKKTSGIKCKGKGCQKVANAWKGYCYSCYDKTRKRNKGKSKKQSVDQPLTIDLHQLSKDDRLEYIIAKSPTSYKPGSKKRMKVYQLRVKFRLPLNNPKDTHIKVETNETCRTQEYFKYSLD